MACTTYEDPDKNGVASLNEPESESDFMDDWLDSGDLMVQIRKSTWVVF